MTGSVDAFSFDTNYVIDGDAVTLTCALRGELNSDSTVMVVPPGGRGACATMYRDTPASPSNCSLLNDCVGGLYTTECTGTCMSLY